MSSAAVVIGALKVSVSHWQNQNRQFPLLNFLAPFMEDILISAKGVTKLPKTWNPSGVSCGLYIVFLPSKESHLGGKLNHPNYFSIIFMCNSRMFYLKKLWGKSCSYTSFQVESIMGPVRNLSRDLSHICFHIPNTPCPQNCSLDIMQKINNQNMYFTINILSIRTLKIFTVIVIKSASFFYL